MSSAYRYHHQFLQHKTNKTAVMIKKYILKLDRHASLKTSAGPLVSQINCSVPAVNGATMTKLLPIMI